jgi:hypothetical protein
MLAPPPPMVGDLTPLVLNSKLPRLLKWAGLVSKTTPNAPITCSWLPSRSVSPRLHVHLAFLYCNLPLLSPCLLALQCWLQKNPARTKYASSSPHYLTTWILLPALSSNGIEHPGPLSLGLSFVASIISGSCIGKTPQDPQNFPATTFFEGPASLACSLLLFTPAPLTCIHSCMNCIFTEGIIADSVVVDCAAYCFFCLSAVDDSTKLNDND